MELIIKLNDKTYKETMNRTEFDTLSLGIKLIEAVQNGTQLPKGHGDLIDRNECLKMKVTDLHDKDGITMYAVPTGNILRMKPTIEADKENERMIPFIRKSLENGSLIAKDYITTEWDGYEQGRRKIRREHRIMLEDIRTGERVFIDMFKEGDNK